MDWEPQTNRVWPPLSLTEVSSAGSDVLAWPDDLAEAATTTITYHVTTPHAAVEWLLTQQHVLMFACVYITWQVFVAAASLTVVT